MESSAALRSFNYSVGAISQLHCSLERHSTVHMYPGCWPTSRKSCVSGLMFGGKNNSSTRQNVTLISCVKTPEATITVNSNVPLDSTTQGLLEKKISRNATFPNGFEALVLEVCDETEVAELKMKIGDFEMHLKRNVGATQAPLSNISPTTAPPIPTKPMSEIVAATPPPSQPKPSPEKPTPFKNVAFGKSSKLAALEASGSSNYVLVSSPIVCEVYQEQGLCSLLYIFGTLSLTTITLLQVGTFQRGRTVKGKKQPPICKEGDLIKEGQVIGFLDQFGTELPVKSDVAGEVLKLLFDVGDGVGYGDPLIAVLPSFHGIK
ncbi:hypothetical protein CRYUN_Cryun05aG0143700 [Craigia yunnanensis]